MEHAGGFAVYAKPPDFFVVDEGNDTTVPTAGLAIPPLTKGIANQKELGTGTPFQRRINTVNVAPGLSISRVFPGYPASKLS